MVEELKNDLLKRVQMGQALKKGNDWIAIDCRLLSIWKGNGDGLFEVRYKEEEDGKLKFRIRFGQLDYDREIKDLDADATEIAEMVETLTEEYCTLFPNDKLEWDFLGN